jgi:hypothetical protein
MDYARRRSADDSLVSNIEQTLERRIGDYRVSVSHGAYLMRTRSGADATQLLEPRVTLAPATFTPLPVTGAPVTNGTGGQVETSFWGRGRVGDRR